MITKRKRAPGGGRKPQGAFSRLTSPLTIRMPADMRKRLETSANKRRESITQELLRRLQDSFDGDLKFSSSNSAARALTFLFEENLNWVAQACEMLPTEDDDSDDASADDRAENWQLDRYIFRSFRLALCKLLEALEPKGEIRPPFDWEKLAEDAEDELKKDPPEDADLSRASLASWKSPEVRAQYVANAIWSSLQRTALTKSEIEAERVWDELGVPKAAYGMSHARRDLKLTSKGKRS